MEGKKRRKKRRKKRVKLSDAWLVWCNAESKPFLDSRKIKKETSRDILAKF